MASRLGERMAVECFHVGDGRYKKKKKKLIHLLLNRQGLYQDQEVFLHEVV